MITTQSRRLLIDDWGNMEQWLLKWGDKAKALRPVTLAIIGFGAKLFRQVNAQKNINIATARKDIIGIFEKAKDRGFTTIYEHEAMTDLLKNYYELGGNGTIKHIEKLYNAIRIETNPLDKSLEKRI